MSLRIEDIQIQSWKEFLEEDLKRTVSNQSEILDGSDVKVEFELIPPKISDPLVGEYIKKLSSEEDYFFEVVVDARVTSDKSATLTASQSRKMVVAKLPVYTPRGFIVKGNTYIYYNELVSADGWYTSDKGGTVIERRAYKSPTILIGYSKELGGAYFSKLGSKVELPISILTYALYGKDIATLNSAMGDFPEILSDSIAVDEIYKLCNRYEVNVSKDASLKTRCGALIIKALALTAGGRYKEENIQAILDKKLKSDNYARAKYGIKRAESSFSYSERCLGMVLADDIAGYSRGTILDKKILKELDAKKIPSLKVKKSLTEEYYTVVAFYTEENSKPWDVAEFCSAMNLYYMIRTGYEFSIEQRSMDNICLKTLSLRFCEEVEIRLIRIKDEVNKRSGIKGGTINIATILDEVSKLLAKESNNFLRNLHKDRSFQQISLVSEIAQHTKGSKVRPEGSSSNVPMTSRMPRIGERGRLCANETPDGENIGLVRTLAVYANVDKHYCITAPYYKVNNGVVDTSKIINLNYLEEKMLLIAPADADLSNDSVYAYAGGEIELVKSKEIDYIEYSTEQNFGLGVCHVPFSNTNTGRRNAMSAGNVRQAIPTIGSEIPIVGSTTVNSMSHGSVTVGDIWDSVLRDPLNNKSLDEYIDGILTYYKCSTIGDRKLDFKLECKGKETLYFTMYVETFAPSDIGSTRSTKVTALTGDSWSYADKDQVIMHSADVVTVERNIYGGGTESITASKLGVNLKVLYKFHEGFGIDDAIIIRKGLLEAQSLSSLFVTEQKVRIDSNARDTQKRVKLPDELDAHFLNVDEFGLPIVGTYVERGQQIMTLEVIKSGGSIIGASSSSKEEAVRASISGYIMRVRESEEGYVIQLGGIAPIERGDKMTGRHGNKGVISKIVADADMPRLEDGTIPDIILNPLGVTSRSSYGQLEESAVALLGIQDKSIKLLKPYEDISEYSVNKLREAGLSEVDVYDGRTGRKFGHKMFIGTQYFYKLEHTSSSKVHALGNCGDMRKGFTAQPREGKKNKGAQKCSEYMMNALISAGATKVYRELSTAQSDNYKGGAALDAIQKRKGLQLPHDMIKVDYTNKSYEFLMPIYYSMGIQFTKDGFDILTQPEIDDIQVETLVRLNPNDVKRTIEEQIREYPENGKNREGSRALYYKIHFDGNQLVMPVVLESEYFRGSFPVLVYKYDYRKEEDYCTWEVLTDKKIRYDVIDSKTAYYVLEANSGKKYVIRVTEDYENLFREKFKMIDIESYRYLSGDAIIEMIKCQTENYNLSKECISDIEFSIEVTKSEDKEDRLKFKPLYFSDNPEPLNIKLVKNTKVLEAVKLCLRTNIEKNRHPEEFIVGGMLMAPAALRNKIMEYTKGKNSRETGNYSLDDLSNAYVQIINAVIRGNLAGLYSTLYTVTGIKIGDSGGKIKVNNGRKTFIEYLTGKNALFRENLLGKRVMYSGRAVLTPAPEIAMTQAKIPCYIIADIFETFLQSRLKSDDFSRMEANSLIKAFKYNDFSKHTDAEREYIWGLARKAAEGKPVIIVREPAFHEFSALSFQTIITTDTTVGIPPIVAPAYNADYDGDQVAVYYPQSDEACAEALEKLSPDKVLVNIKDNKLAVDLYQDIALGLYLATGEPDSVSGNILPMSSVAQIKTMFLHGKLGLRDLVAIKVLDRLYVSTAGRILLNDCFPKNTTFTRNKWTNPMSIPVPDEFRDRVYELCYDHIFRIGDISKLRLDIVGMMRLEQAAETFDNLKDLGFKASDYEGITLSIFDYNNVGEVQNLVQKTKKMLTRNELYERLQILGVEDSREIFQTTLSNLNNKVESISRDSLKGKSSLDKIIDSGARGSVSNIREAVGVIGMATNGLGKVQNYPVLNNYISGLRSIDAVVLSAETLAGSIGTSKKTQQTGYDGRKLKILMQDLKITEEDCGSRGVNLTVMYEDSTKLEKYVGKEVVGVDVTNKLGFYSQSKHIEGMLTLLGDKFELTLDKVALLNKLKPASVKFSDGTVVNLTYKIDKSIMNIIIGHEGLSSLFEEHKGFKLYGGSDRDVYTEKCLEIIEELQLPKIRVRLIHTCEADSLCRTCYGIDFGERDLPRLGKMVGLKAASAMHESIGQASLNSKHKGLKKFRDNTISQLVGHKLGLIDGDPKTGFSTKAYNPMYDVMFINLINGHYKINNSKDFTSILINDSLGFGTECLFLKGCLDNMQHEGIIFAGDELNDTGTIDLNYVREMAKRLFDDRDCAESYLIYKAYSRYRNCYNDKQFNTRIIELAAKSHETVSVVTDSDDDKHPIGSYVSRNFTKDGVETAPITLGLKKKLEFSGDFLTHLLFEGVSGVLRKSIGVKQGLKPNLYSEIGSFRDIVSGEAPDIRELYREAQEVYLNTNLLVPNFDRFSEPREIALEDLTESARDIDELELLFNETNAVSKTNYFGKS